MCWPPIGKEYQLNVDKDLVPVCPNCHYMLHRKDPPYTIEELKSMLQNTTPLIPLHDKDFTYNRNVDEESSKAAESENQSY